MTDQVIYPALQKGLETRLAAIDIGAKANPNYFKSKDCPYSPQLVGYLQAMMRVAVAERILVEKAEGIFQRPEGEKFDVILREVEITIEQMKDLEVMVLGGESTMDAGDRIQLFKAKTSMLEKWTLIKEKIYSMKEVAVFQKIVVSAMDEILSKDQRLELMQKFRGLRSLSEMKVDGVGA